VKPEKKGNTDMSLVQETWMARLANPEAVAIRALGFLASRRAELERFLAHTGLTHADLKRQPAEPEHLAAILDFLISHEPTLLEFSRAVDLPPEAAYEARRLFSHLATPGRRWPPYLERGAGRPTATVSI
jgi:hypothetical protein